MGGETCVGDFFAFFFNRIAEVLLDYSDGSHRIRAQSLDYL